MTYTVAAASLQRKEFPAPRPWIPAFAGMTVGAGNVVRSTGSDSRAAGIALYPVEQHRPLRLAALTGGGYVVALP